MKIRHRRELGQIRNILKRAFEDGYERKVIYDVCPVVNKQLEIEGYRLSHEPYGVYKTKQIKGIKIMT